jgi:hypothetical protein
MAKALNAMRICVFRWRAGTNRQTEERTLRLSPLGNIATRSAAIAVGIPMVPSFGSASIKAVSRTTAVSLGIRVMCGCIWTPPDCNSRLDCDRWSQLLTYIRLHDAAGQRLRREPRWVFARFHLKAPTTLEHHAGPHIRFGKRRSDRFAISCHLLQLPGWDLLSLFAASLHAAFTDSAGS